MTACGGTGSLQVPAALEHGPGLASFLSGRHHEGGRQQAAHDGARQGTVHGQGPSQECRLLQRAPANDRGRGESAHPSALTFSATYLTRLF